MQGRLKNTDHQFKILATALQNRKIDDEELEKEKLENLLKKNNKLSEEEIQLSLGDKNIIEIYRLMEESYNEKKKVLFLKRQFIDNIRKMKEHQQNELEKVFENLNSIEDEYMILERVISNLQMAISQNKEELESIQKQIKFSKEKKKELHDLNEKLKTEKNEINDKQNSLEKELDNIKNTNNVEEIKINKQKDEIRQIQAKLVSEQLLLFEYNEKHLLLQKAISDVDLKILELNSLKTIAQNKSDFFIKALKEKIQKKVLGESELKKAHDMLQTIENGENLKNSLYELDEDLKTSIHEIVSMSQNLAKQKKSFGLCEQEVLDFISKKDVI